MPKKRFAKVNIEISNICNLQCSFCPEVVREKGMMDPALFDRIVAEVAPFTEQVCLHLMGDPLVHPKLEAFVEACARHATPVFLVTNGVLLRDLQTDLLLHPIVRQVNFSLHSFPDNFPDRDPAPYLEKIFAFTERAFRERPDLYVNFRLWNLDAPDGDPRGTAARNRRMLELVRARFGGEGIPETIDVRTQKGYRLLERLSLHFDTEFVWPSPDLPVLGETGFCRGLSNHFGILVDGTVVPCCLDKEGNIPLGNVRDATIAEILESPRARAILRGFRERKLVEDLCRRCDYIERFRVPAPA
ncbi:MAG: SPASM domain-containing protein [Bdellovibrionales bacterium]|nr:SPASM domain-containing protein [Bdellovibrionales bacterium]